MIKSINTINEIKIPNNAQFYCLVGKTSGLSFHSFFQMGYIDQDNNAHPLVEVGKSNDGGLMYGDTGVNARMNSIFSHTGSIIKNEKRMLRKFCFTDLFFDINYSANKISRDQYLSFITLLCILYYSELD